MTTMQSPIAQLGKGLLPTPPLEATLDAIERVSVLPIEQGATLPASAYTDPAYTEFEWRSLLADEWHAVAHESQIPEIGDTLRLDVLGEPVVVVRGKDRKVRVLSRTCRHRAMDIMPEGFGHVEKSNHRMLLCPYHYWVYDLDGKLRGSPEMHRSDGFDRTQVSLHEFASEVWEGFVFMSLGKPGASVEQKMGGLREQFIGRWTLSDAEVVWERHWDSNFNWKMLVENFMEPYHHMGSHRKTLEPMMPARGCWTEPEQDGWSAVHLPLTDKLQDDADHGKLLPGFKPFPKLQPDDHKQWWVFQGFPTFLLFVGPQHLYWYRLLPTGPQTCSLLTTMLVWKGAKDDAEYQRWYDEQTSLLVDVHMEDVEALEGMQRGVNTLGFEQGRLSHLEEPIRQFQRWLGRKVRAVREGTMPASASPASAYSSGAGCGCASGGGCGH